MTGVLMGGMIKMMSGARWYDRSASNELDGSIGDTALRALGEHENTRTSLIPVGLSWMLKTGASAAMPHGVPFGFASAGSSGDDAIHQVGPAILASSRASARQLSAPSSTGSKALTVAASVAPIDRRLPSEADRAASSLTGVSEPQPIAAIQAVASKLPTSKEQGASGRRAITVLVDPSVQTPTGKSSASLRSDGGLALAAAVGLGPDDVQNGVAGGPQGSRSGGSNGEASAGVLQTEAADVGVGRSPSASLSAVPRSGGASLITSQGAVEGYNVGRWIGSDLAGADIVPRTTSVGGRSIADTSSIGAREAPASPSRVSPVWSENRQGQPSQPPGRKASQQQSSGLMVALRGDVLMDGRKMGRIVAAGQTSAASLPGVSSSAVNLRAMPVFSGTSVPL